MPMFVDPLTGAAAPNAAQQHQQLNGLAGWPQTSNLAQQQSAAAAASLIPWQPAAVIPPEFFLQSATRQPATALPFNAQLFASQLAAPQLQPNPQAVPKPVQPQAQALKAANGAALLNGVPPGIDPMQWELAMSGMLQPGTSAAAAYMAARPAQLPPNSFFENAGVPAMTSAQQLNSTNSTIHHNNNNSDQLNMLMNMNGFNNVHGLNNINNINGLNNVNNINNMYSPRRPPTLPTNHGSTTSLTSRPIDSAQLPTIVDDEMNGDFSNGFNYNQRFH